MTWITNAITHYTVLADLARDRVRMFESGELFITDVHWPQTDHSAATIENEKRHIRAYEKAIEHLSLRS